LIKGVGKMNQVLLFTYQPETGSENCGSGFRARLQSRENRGQVFRIIGDDQELSPNGEPRG
jgi:hypothetical protein